MKAVSKRGLLCTPHPLASEAGLEILDQGGSAIDAMLAASAVLAVVYPHMTGLGGDALWLLSDGSRVDTLMGLGQAGQRLPEGGSIRLRGPASAATTAGALRSWSLAQKLSHERWGSRLDWAQLLERAEYYADDGMSISASQAFWQQQRAGLIRELPDLQALCCDASGALLPEGSRLRQPRLAETLRQLRRAGVDDFYDGELATALAEGFERLGCGLNRADLAATRARLESPIRVRYRRGWLYNVAPPTQGLYTLRALHMLNRVDLAAFPNGSTDYYHFLIEAIKTMLAQRNAELCDPECGPFEWSSQLSEARAAADFANIDPQRAKPWGEAGRPADTIWMAASDEQGRTACLIQSLFHDFGSGCMAGDTGVLWLNRAAGFHPDPAHPNAWAPGKRPAHTLNPSCYFGDDGEQLYFGTQGGDGQPQTQMVLATQLIDYRTPVESALRTPRFLLGRSFFDSTDNLKLEADMAPDTLAGLAARGHQTETIPPLSPFTGQAGIIAIRTDGLREAMHDPRGQGVSLAQS